MSAAEMVALLENASAEHWVDRLAAWKADWLGNHWADYLAVRWVASLAAPNAVGLVVCSAAMWGPHLVFQSADLTAAEKAGSKEKRWVDCSADWLVVLLAALKAVEMADGTAET